MSTTSDPYPLLWLQQVAPNVGIESERSPRMKQKLKFQGKLRIWSWNIKWNFSWNISVRSWGRVGWGLLKSPFAESNTLSGTETEVKYGKFRELKNNCLLRWILKAGGTKISEGQLLELLQTTEKDCSWFLSLGTLDLGTWEKVGSEFYNQRESQSQKTNQSDHKDDSLV